MNATTTLPANFSPLSVETMIAACLRLPPMERQAALVGYVTSLCGFVYVTGKMDGGREVEGVLNKAIERMVAR